jgi:hypothetical protein
MACALAAAPERNDLGSRSEVLAVLLVIDASASVNHYRLSSDYTFKDVVEAVNARLSPGDIAGFGFMTNHASFSDMNLAAAAFKTSAYGMLQALDHDRFGPSPLWDTLLDAIARVSTMNGRRAIIVVTDGKSTGNIHGSAECSPRVHSKRMALECPGQPMDHQHESAARLDGIQSSFAIVSRDWPGG